MSSKAARPTKEAPKESPKKTAQQGEKKGEKKSAKAAAPMNAKDEETVEQPAISVDEAEELEEAAEEAAATGGNSNAAALAAASGSSDMSASFKNFRHHPDMENFYRFIYENDLRHEALAIIDTIMTEKQVRKAATKGASKH